MIKRFRKKMPVVEAIKFIDTTKNIDEISMFVDKIGVKEIRVDYSVKGTPVIKISFKNKIIRVAKDEYLVKGVDDLYTCLAPVFEKNFEEVKE